MAVELMRCFRAAKSRFDMELVAYSVMSNHLHLIVGAKDDRSLRRGLQGLGIRLARAVNRVLGRRGKVFRERFFARALRTQRAVFYAMRYALQNARKHGVPIPAGEWDPYSSGRFHRPSSESRAEPPPVTRPDWCLWPWMACALNLIQPTDLPGPRAYA